MTAPRSARSTSVRAIPAPFHPRPLPVAEPRRPQLHVLPEPPHVRARRLCRLFTALSGLAVCFGLFGVVGLHVLLAQGQGDVQRLSEEVRQQEEEQQRLRLQVAELGSPARIVSEARQRLGMVSPSTVVSLDSASLADPPSTTIPAPRSTSAASVGLGGTETSEEPAASETNETAETTETTVETSPTSPLSPTGSTGTSRP